MFSVLTGQGFTETREVPLADMGIGVEIPRVGELDLAVRPDRLPVSLVK